MAGTKPGVLSFLGETRFAPGQWAGVTLDEPNGKLTLSRQVSHINVHPKKYLIKTDL